MTPGGNSRPPDVAWPAELVQALSGLPDSPRLWVAYSGGLDSTLLLNALCHSLPDSQRGRLRAVHVNHQLQANASACEAACRSQCEALAVPLTVAAVEVAPGPGDGGLEAEARRARYRVFEDLLGEGDLLLMAHHQNDQTETLLFRFLRGTGVAGLAGMPAQRRLGRGTLMRPLLGFDRAQIRAWAEAAGLTWVDDPSNQDRRFDRNFLRHEIIPRARQRWPGLEARLGHTAARCREQVALADSLARIQARDCVDGAGHIRLDALAALPPVEQKNLVRWWIASQGHEPPAPAQLDTGLPELLAAAPDRAPELRTEAYCLRRYRQTLHLVPVADAVELLGGQPLTAAEPLPWQGGRLALEPAGPQRVDPPRLTVTRRMGGERFRERPGGPTRSLKKWLQEQEVPPWQRASLPLVWEAGELVAIGHLWRSSHFAGEAPASGWRILWERDFN
ncbi:MAG: tRNA lysidine(34) synthetase TilS [Marinobacter sp.]|uniref:tRNA lysidine(34) synthetase TilS n=1 Tax=Marinobacter sp. TaxID=50741 RepID=UPI00299D83AD|nr:tRNA lysidine(34) synthetase TilS [Marinobacter sp.]MDX1636122.1 tRNA lysidine(34) synthetase TilS [Marinobacter sp.]